MGKLPVVTPFPAQPVNGGARCFAQEAPPINDLLEHPLPERESRATTAFSRFIETQGLTRWFGASSAHQGAPYILRQAVTKLMPSLGIQELLFAQHAIFTLLPQLNLWALGRFESQPGTPGVVRPHTQTQVLRQRLWPACFSLPLPRHPL